MCDCVDPQLPEVSEGDVVGAEATVDRVGVPTDGQQMEIAEAHPRDLESTFNWNVFLSIFIYLMEG